MKRRFLLAGVPVGDGHPVRLMGVINVSPESFYKGSVFTEERQIAQTAEKMTRARADFIDVGAMSTAPYLKTRISEEEERKRLTGAIRLIRKISSVPISVDTSRYGPAAAALEAGASILNDVTGLALDPQLKKLAPHVKGLILMANSLYWDPSKLTKPVRDTKKIFAARVKTALSFGFRRHHIVLDPGIGFFRKAKLPWWKRDLEILRRLPDLKKLGFPLLIGLSRKSFIGEILGDRPAEERLAGSLAATALAVANGAAIIRTHDVIETKDVIRVAEAITNSKEKIL
ncbi:MAG: dihydropteroate synthase [Elusimicrobia bacterium]|nr:dihydropteroate synthase [Candidatus Obscuribacterium magneticum]MCB4755867.1 dihydropteroate synthase [Candidatus Obscuribacterium magneticum]